MDYAIMDYNRDLLCKDCQHAHRSLMNKVLFVKHYQCYLPDNISPKEYDPVTGKSEGGDFRSCRIARLASGVCGPDGRRWTPRNPRKHLFTVLKQNYDRTT